MKENVFGLPMNLFDSREEAEAKVAEEPTLYAVLRCSDLPRHAIPEPVRSRNQIGWCVKCNASVWIDPEAYVRGTFPTCMQCLPGNYDMSALRSTVEQVRKLYPET